MQTKPKVSAMKRETVKGGKVTKQVAIKTPSKKIMVMSESGKPQSLADRLSRAKGMANSLDAMSKQRAAAGGPKSMAGNPKMVDMPKKTVRYTGIKKK